MIADYARQWNKTMQAPAALYVSTSASDFETYAAPEDTCRTDQAQACTGGHGVLSSGLVARI